MSCTDSTASDSGWTFSIPDIYSANAEVYKAGAEDVLEKLRMFGEALCIILDVLPSDQFSFLVNVSEKCSLEFTVKKV